MPEFEQRRQRGRRLAQIAVENERRLGERRQQQIWEDAFDTAKQVDLGPEPTVTADEIIAQWDAADAEASPKRTVGHSSYWDDMAEFMEPGQTAPMPAGGAEEAMSYGYTKRWAQRGQAAKAALGRLGQRAMAIPGVEPAVVMGRTAGRYLGPALGVAGPVFDAMAVNELYNQYGEAKAGLAHKQASEMHTANKYATPLAAKRTRQEFGRKRARKTQEQDIMNQALSDESTIQMTPGGESLFQLPDDTFVSSDNLRRMRGY